MQNNPQLYFYDDNIDLHEISRVLWLNKKLIVAITAVFMFFSLTLAMIMPVQYKSTVILAPVQQETGGVSDALNRLGSIASFAGLSLGSGSTSEAKIAEEIIKSWGFIEGFIEKHSLKVPLHAASGWDRENNSLVIDTNIYDQENQRWLLEDTNGELREPTSWELYKNFSDRLSVSSDQDIGLIRLSFEHYSPYLAKEWLDLIFTEINSHMQQRKLDKVNSNIEYLQKQIEKTSISHMQTVFYTIIEEQIKSKMLAEASPEHTFVLVSKSMIAEEPSSTKPLIIFLLGGLLGLTFAIVVVLLRYGIAKTKDPLPTGSL